MRVAVAVVMWCSSEVALETCQRKHYRRAGGGSVWRKPADAWTSWGGPSRLRRPDVNGGGGGRVRAVGRKHDPVGDDSLVERPVSSLSVFDSAAGGTASASA